MADIPFILAGPILRRITPLNVSVWIALSRPSKVKLSIWNKPIDAGAGSASFDESSDPPLLIHTVRKSTITIGVNLHITVVNLELDPLDALTAGALYSYNLSFEGIGEDTSESDLKSNGLLVDKGADNGTFVGHLALGYKSGYLPTFVLPPLTLEGLNLVHGSCRKAHGYGKDSLAALDSVITESIIDDTPAKRIHQLYFTGDQIYADEVPISMVYYINKLGAKLMGFPEKVDAEKTDLTSGNEPVNNASGYPGLTDPRPVPVTLENFPPSRRHRVIKNIARLTTDSLADDPTERNVLDAVGINHLISFSEFCATYLLYWSNSSWNYAFSEFKTISPARLTDPWKNEDLTSIGEALFDLNVLEIWKTDDLTPLETALCPRVAAENNLLNKERAKDGELEVNKRLKKQYEQMRDRCKEELGDVETFIQQLPKVRRVLANTATYMIFDDHEVADDWNATREWREKVYQSKLGRNMVRNALAAYSIFQDWGNLPASYESGTKSELLTALQQMFRPDPNSPPNTFPNPAAEAKLDVLFGLNLTDESRPPLHWHFSVPCGEIIVYVLDTRTRRTFPSKTSPPGLMTADAMDVQIPLEPGPERVVIFISPAPVLGLGTLEILLQPAMVILNEMEADPESWALNQPALEAFLARMQPFKKVVFLSGDVHYGVSTSMHYWELNDPVQSRFVQLVSSSLKNEKFLNSRFMISSMVQRVMGNLFYPIERLGWKLNADLQVTNAENKSYQPVQRVALRREPVLLNGRGWPPDTLATPEPDWRWRMEILRDNRKDVNDGDATTEERPEAIWVTPFDPDINPDSGVAEAYAEVMARHIAIHKNSVPRSVVWNSNIGLVNFSTDAAGDITIHHKYLYWLEGDQLLDKPDYYTTFSTAMTQYTGEIPNLKME